MYYELLKKNIIRYDQPNKQNSCNTLKHTTVRGLAAKVVPFSPHLHSNLLLSSIHLFFLLLALCIYDIHCQLCVVVLLGLSCTCVCPRVTFSPHPSPTLLCLWAIFTIDSTQKKSRNF
uniref:(northern house mosquito) hypothetical protein n=1 Tax=Culex pipiens TaxID=7175 RepID=A0A8D8F1I6_CULPI